jgi:hypothetical protein
MKSLGWHQKVAVLILSLAALFTSASVFAGSYTVRDIILQSGGIAQIQLDGAPPKGALEFDYVRDIVQFSIQNSTIYPAKIIHADASDSQAFSKVFAYQYAPNLVRVRFSVSGNADVYKGKVKMELKGKTITITFPSAIASKSDSNEHEKSLLAKVLGRTDVKVEKIEARAPSEEKLTSNSEVKAEAKAKVEAKEEVRFEPEVENKTEVKAKSRLTGTRSTGNIQLGSARQGPSAFRSILAMFLVVGGLGLVLIYVKRKKTGIQAKRVGDSWLSNMLAGAKKQKTYIEVLANHALGPKQSITVVRIKDQQFVLGVTQDNVQLITQLDADEADLDVLDDPKVADSIGKMFGAKPQVIPAEPKIDLGASFNTLLKSSNGAGAIVARSAYQSQQVASSAPVNVSGTTAGITQGSGARNQLRQRLQGMKSL